MKRACLVDASLYVFRAWHAFPDRFHAADGTPMNAVHGFCRFLLDLLERERPEHLALAFDVSLTTSFRNAIYPAYKANRPAPPAALVRQFERCRALAAALGLCVLADTTYEADDLIGSAARALRAAGLGALVVSADKDFGQLLTDADEQWDYARDERWRAAQVPERMGVRADQVVDFLALAGDSVDNIPGVRGIGVKTAAALLAHFDTLDALLERIEEIPFLRLRGAAAVARRLREEADQARLSRQLATIAVDAPVPEAPGDYVPRAIDSVRLDALCTQLRIGPGTRQRMATLTAQR